MPYAGLLGLDSLLLLAGFGVLLACGAVELSTRGALAAAGLAFLVGVASVLMVTVALMVVGVPALLPTVAVVSVAVAGAGLLLARRGGGLPRRDRRAAASAGRNVWERLRATSLDRWIVTAFAVAFGAFALAMLLDAAVTTITAYDAWTLWIRKALVLYHFGTPPAAFFASPDYGFTSPDYPLLLPLLESYSFQAMGAIDTQTLHVQFWLLYVAFGWALAYVGNRITRPAIWAPIVLLALVAPGIWGALLTAYADVPMAMFLCVGVLLVGIWLSRGRPGDLALGVVLLAGAASTKNEGLMAAVSVLVVAAVLLAVERRFGALRRLGLGAGALLLLILPWRAWSAIEGVQGQLPLGQGLNPGYLAGRVDRVVPAVRALVDALDDQDAWLYLLPLALGLAVVCLIVGAARRLAVFYLASMAMLSGFLVWAYWISQAGIEWHLGTSVGRVSTGVVLVALAGLLQLAGELHERGAAPIEEAVEVAVGEREQPVEAVGAGSGAPR